MTPDCPSCGSGAVEECGPVDGDPAEAAIVFECQACGNQWAEE